MKRSHRTYVGARAGFTLIELLVVIIIITILAAFLVPAAMRAMARAQQARVSLEISNLASALESYKAEYGSFPPDFAFAAVGSASMANPNFTQINNHLRGTFRNRVIANDEVPSFANLDPSEALFFWLGGTAPDPTGNHVHGGFSKDPRRPKTGDGERTPRFDFDQSRLRDEDGDGLYEYYPPGQKLPYVYFNSSSYDAIYGNTSSAMPVPDANLASNGSPILRGTDASKMQTLRPYVSRYDLTTNKFVFAETGRFQILSAGADDNFGPVIPNDKPNYQMLSTYLYPTGPYDTAHRDNITSFAAGTLEDKMQ